MPDRSLTPALTAFVVAATLALTACAGEPGSSPTPSATDAAPAEAVVPSSEPAEAEPRIAAILVRADAVEYLDASGGPIDAARDPYADPVDTVLVRLTELLGEPAVETYESQFTEGTGTLHRWDGLDVVEYPAGIVADVPDAPTWGVQLEAASVGGLQLVTVGGLAVGDPAPDDLERTACNSLMAEVVGTVGVEVDGTPTVTSIRSPIYTDACE